MNTQSVSVVLAGSGGAGVITAGTILLEAAGEAGWYAYMTRSAGAQIRGGEATATLRFSHSPLFCQDDQSQLLVGIDWQNLGKYAKEMALSSTGLIVTDPAQGAVPDQILASGAAVYNIAFKKLARSVAGGRPNMLAVGAIAKVIGLPVEAIAAVLEKILGYKGEAVLTSSLDAVKLGMELAADIPSRPVVGGVAKTETGKRWTITGNKGVGLGVIRGGVRYVAAYPITPATEILEWLAPALDRVGGALVQVEDELASINHILGASYGGVPAMTATSGPGLALMTESIGLGVAAELPVVIVNVMRGGPSTGIPTKAEQSDLNIALHGLHGDAPHIVLGANSVTDCIFTAQWSVHLAETLQVPTILLSDQGLGQAQAVVDKPREFTFDTRRLVAESPPMTGKYQRYQATESGVSEMAIPGTTGCQYTADGLEHAESGLPSSMESDHLMQLKKRLRKLVTYDYGDYWADIEGEGEVAVLTWGSCTPAAREALARLKAKGQSFKLISIRLLSPVLPDKFAQAMAGVKKVLVVEQSFSAQFLHNLKSAYPLPAEVKSFARPGPLAIKPGEICEQLESWR